MDKITENKNVSHWKATSRIWRNPQYSKADFLWFLFNKLGAYDLRLAYSYTGSNGQLRFSKWKYYRELMHLDFYDIVPGTRDTRREYIRKVSHRSILDIEVLLDIDDKGRYKSIENKARAICRKLDKFNMAYSCYFTGSKSYHISVLILNLRDYPQEERRELKTLFLAWLGCDSQKSSENSLIALEGEPHYKSGQIKTEVFL